MCPLENTGQKKTSTKTLLVFLSVVFLLITDLDLLFQLVSTPSTVGIITTSTLFQHFNQLKSFHCNFTNNIMNNQSMS